MAIPCESKALEQASYIESPCGAAGKVDRRVHDTCANEKLDTLISLQGGASGTPFFSDAQTVTTPGSTQVLISETVAVGKTLKLKSVRISGRQSLFYKILIDAAIVGSGRIGAGNFNDEFIFRVERSAAAGAVVKVEAVASSGKPATDVECYLQALEI